MFSLLKRNNDEDAPLPKPEAPAPGNYSNQHEFIPYYCHYNADTLLTKNGELLKIIKISGNNFGLNYESGQGTENTLRDIIRRAIGEHVTHDKFAFWIHTLRRRDPVHYESSYKEPFAALVNEKWQQKSNWKHQYHNEIYITILHDGQTAELVERKNLKHVILPERNRVYRNRFLEQSYMELDTLVGKVVKTVRQHYNAHCLQTVERISEDIPGLTGKPLFYSEIMEFLGIVCSLKATPFPLSETPIDSLLTNHQLIFGYNALETRDTKGARRFAGILTLKHYHEILPDTVDRILQFPVELIISQSFHYIPYGLATKEYRDQKMIFDISEDAYSIKASGLQHKLDSNKKTPTSFGKQQTNIMVLADDINQLDNEISKAQQIFADLGLIVIREDIKLEESYWAQLPGNFEFTRRQDIIVASEIAGFCRLNLFPNGNSSGNHWGDALALVPTVVNSPYFLNLHVQDNGHTVLFDYNSFHDQTGLTLLNFLITASLKYQPRLYVFDHANSSRLFFDKMKGRYYLSPLGEDGGTAYSLNPFQLEDNPRNQSFLLAWCISLTEPYIEMTPERRDALQRGIAALYARPEQDRNLHEFLQLLGPGELTDAFAHFHGRGQYAGLFDATAESVDFNASLSAFDIDEIAHAGKVALPLFSYLMHRIITHLDGRPTIIVLHDAWRLLENSFIAPRLESLLEMLKQNNAMVISMTGSPQEVAGSATLQTLMRSCATRIYLPDDVSLQYASDKLGLSAYDSNMLRRMERQKGDFLIKQHSDSVGLRVNLEQMDDIRAIFAGDIKNLIAAGGQFSSLPDFY